ncbi:2-(1,2-epoxy-1,2-dihydrophenyl)acetyl-CoA isomerase PaaG [Limnohabitans sp.]|uniref:2-(1,2-epoxy-1,2-dihydrophenyl)acetyl-CoA isomerase PaaG n=1 Tax=Limnohabitans sp. TaxID=1907725 RepID=UPI00286F8421|nr:2-(1,2-epoxy-1,2-dihydrophenyl)acetyl-CoA isomerase PaaG [Limnohabitans sp.]
MHYTHIQWEVDQGIARLTLNRPDKMNSFHADMHAEMRHALDLIQTDTAIRVLVITGAGRGFCAGQDLADPEVRFTPGETPPDLGDVVERQYKPLIMRLRNLRVPTLAAVNGVAAGAGASLALACDMVVASHAASFMLPFAKIGLIPDTGCSWHLPHRIGQARALGLAMTGQKLSAQQAAEWGMIWEAVADDAFVSRVQTLAQQLSTMPTQALARTRQAMQSASSHTLEEHLSYEGMLMRELGQSADYVEGVSAFLEKRTPRFTGA